MTLMTTCNPILMPINLIPRGRAAYHSWPESQGWYGVNGAARRGLRGGFSCLGARPRNLYQNSILSIEIRYMNE